MFCKNCGEELNNNQVVCVKCGMKVGNGTKYCLKCGAETEKKFNEDMYRYAEHVSVPPTAMDYYYVCPVCGMTEFQDEDFIKASAQTKSETAFCRNCGNEMNRNQYVCLACGVKAGDGNKFCQNCGKPINENAYVCVNCGVVVSDSSSAFTSKLGSKKHQPKKKLPKEDKTLMAIVAFLLGGIGIHNFMMGENKKGVLKIICLLTYIGAIITAISVIYDFIKILTDDYVIDPNAWF